MVPNIGKRGTSFKGAGAYFLHDKKQEGEHSRTTTERVDWTHTRNLATDNADFATRIMAATAMQKDALKKAAGVRNTGNKSKGDVYAYSLAWHPDEQGKIDKAEMMKAADQSIKALGAQDHQCVIVAHNDEPHPHIHVIVNMVNPQTGKNLPLSNDRRKLEKWAHDYRVERGEEHIYCPNRTEKMKTIETKKRGEEVDFKRGAKSQDRGAADDFSQAKTHANSNDYKALEAEQRAKDKALSDDGRALASRQASQWEELKDNYTLQKQQISDQYKRDKAALQDEIFQGNKPLLAEKLRQQGLEVHAQKQRDKDFLGKFSTVLQNVRMVRASGGKASYITELFKVVAGNGLERLKQQHARELQTLKSDQNQQTKQAVQELNKRRAARVNAARGLFMQNRASLINKHRDEKGDLKSRWKSRNERKKRAALVITEKGKAQKKEREKIAPATTTAKEQFKKRTRKAREGRQKGRTRSRKRD